MAKRKGIVLWLNLAGGLTWIFIALRNFGVLDFATIHRHNPDNEILAPLQLTVGIISLIPFFIAARNGFSGAAKIPPAITTIFGPRQ